MLTNENVINNIKEWFKQSGSKTAVINISGGADSTYVAWCLVKALGKDNVYGLIQPNGRQKDIDDGEIMIGNEKAMFEYAKYLNDDYSDEDKMKLETLDDALEIIMSKRIWIKKIDINDLDNLYFGVFKKGGRK